MVQTFVLSNDFRSSAKSLDWRRLGKQRVEAMQILYLIKYLKALGRYFDTPAPESGPLAPWIRTVARRYRSLGRELFYAKGAVVEQGGRSMRKLGFAHHPIVRQWFYYTDALKSYINAHIDEWVARGYVNTMKRYSVSADYETPPWAMDDTVHENYRAALTMKAPEWYGPPSQPFTTYWYNECSSYVVL